MVLINIIKDALRAIKYLIKIGYTFIKEMLTILIKERLPANRYLDYAKYRWLVKLLRQFTDYANSPFYAYHVYAEMAYLLKEINHKPQRILELGTGSSLGALFCFHASGVKYTTGIDIQPIINKDETVFYQILRDYAACVAGWKWWRYQSTLGELRDVRYPNNFENIDVKQLLTDIHYISPISADSLPFEENSFDFIYSVASMEHFENVDRVISEIYRICTRGGITIHEIDLRQHGKKEPLDLLKWDDIDYYNRVQRYGDGKGIDGILKGEWIDEVYCNRLRVSDYISIFEKCGFVILKVEPVCVLDHSAIKKDDLSAKFRNKSLEDLSILGVRLVAKKIA